MTPGAAVGVMAWTDAETTDRVIRCIIRVHRKLGPGFIEIIYRRATAIEMRNEGLQIEVEKRVPILHDGIRIGSHRIDLIVENTIVVELKTVERLTAGHYAQTRSNMKATRLQSGLLVNFAAPRADFRRVQPA